MTAISNAQEFYKELTGSYTMDGNHLFELVEAAMDSLLADSLFLGEQYIKLQSAINIFRIGLLISFNLLKYFKYLYIGETGLISVLKKLKKIPGTPRRMTIP